MKKTVAKRIREVGPAPGAWLALGAMAACVGLDGALGQPALAASMPEEAESRRPSQHGQQPVLRFDIEAAPLDKAIAAFRAAGGVQVLSMVPADTLASLTSPGVNGVFTVEQALQQVLSGTGVEYRFADATSVTLSLRGRVESVVVTARLASPTSAKYTEALVDVPQTITVVPRAVIEAQGAMTLRDVLQNVSGLTIQAGEGGTPAGDNLTLRGFSARNDVFVDGVRDLGPQSRDPFNLEQVEVVKGPGSAYTGRGSTGGSINLVSKSPLLTPSAGATLALGTASTRRATLDLNQPLPRLGQGTALRLNLLAHDAATPGRDVVDTQRFGVAPALAFGLGTPTRVTVSYFHLQQENVSDYGIPWVTATNTVLAEFRNRPAPVPRETFYGFRSRDFEDLSSDLGTVRLDREFRPSLSLRSQVRYGRSTRESNATPPRFASDSSTVINRELRAWSTEDEIWDLQSDLTARFHTGGLAHALVTGLSYTNENNVRRTRTGPNSPTTLLDPNPDDVYTGVIVPGQFVGDVTGKSAALYAFDTLSLGSRLELSGGLRFDRFDASGVTTLPAALERVDEMLSGRAGIVFKPAAVASLYAAYGTSLNPSLEGLSYGTANTAIDPEKTRTFELGGKWDLFGQRLLVSAAAFRVEKLNARTPGLLPGDPPQVLQGRQEVQGLELGASGTLAHGWQVFAAYTLLDSEIVESNTPAEVGRELVNTPRHSLSVWTSGRLPGRVGVGLGGRYVSERFGNTINTRHVDGYWLFDGMLSYPVVRRLELRLNLYNLTDSYYFAALGGGHLVPGNGRAAVLNANLKF